MSLTDCLELNKTKLFEKIRQDLPILQKSQNLLDCKDDLLFAWAAQDSCLLVRNWRSPLSEPATQSGLDFQTLIPSNTVCLDVDRVQASNECSLVALSGAHGVCILELPRRWGPDGYFKGGKERITCRSFGLDTLLFQNNPQLEVRQVRWHPHSVSDSTLIVLLNNNTIRVYNHAKLRHVWQVGPTVLLNGGNSSLTDFGEVAVDFDVAPPIKGKDAAPVEQDKTLNQSNKTLMAAKAAKTAGKQERIEWPLVVLRENGNIYVLLTGVDSDRTRLQGPLTITPQAQDNYGLESCSLLVIPSLPPTLVIAESSGKLHHALLMEAEAAEHSFSEVDGFVLIEPSEYVVHVLETVKLELGLTAGSGDGCTIFLKRDLINELRYFAYHNAGLHVVTVSFISEVQRYLESESVEDRLELGTSSGAEYILCTKFESSQRVNAVFGMALLQAPAGVVLLLGSGQVISLKLVIDAQLLTTLNDNRRAGVDVAQQESGTQFVDTIKSLLQRSVNQPILADKFSSASAHESYELLNQAIEVLREQYLKRHDLVKAAFARHINQIKLKKEQQLQEVQDLEQERELISERAHKLAERFEEISYSQELLMRKCCALMKSANEALPSNVVAEREIAQEVNRLNISTQSLAAGLEKAKKTLNKQRYHISKSQEDLKKNAYELPEKQHRTITEILTQLTSEIDRQITDVKRINKIVGV